MTSSDYLNDKAFVLKIKDILLDYVSKKHTYIGLYTRDQSNLLRNIFFTVAGIGAVYKAQEVIKKKYRETRNWYNIDRDI